MFDKVVLELCSLYHVEFEQHNNINNVNASINNNNHIYHNNNHNNHNNYSYNKQQ